MSNEEKIFEEYLDESKSLGERLKQPRFWVYVIVGITVLISLIFLYRYFFMEKMSAKEVKESIEITWMDSKWVEKDVTPHDVKIVPTISFKFKNIGKKPLRFVNFEGVFEFQENGQVHTDGVAQACKEPLMPGEESEEVYVRAFFGYSASSKKAFLKNMEEWKRMNVRLFANTRGSGPVQIGEKYPVKQVIQGMEELVEQTEAELKKDAERITSALKISWNETKWISRKKTPKKAIIVPSIRVKVQNIAKEPVKFIQLKAKFEFDDNGEWLSDGLSDLIKKELPADAETEEILLLAENGYEASSVASFFKNRKNWRIVRAKIFAKIKDSNFILLDTIKIKQEIQGYKVRYH